MELRISPRQLCRAAAAHEEVRQVRARKSRYNLGSAPEATSTFLEKILGSHNTEKEPSDAVKHQNGMAILNHILSFCQPSEVWSNLLPVSKTLNSLVSKSFAALQGNEQHLVFAPSSSWHKGSSSWQSLWQGILHKMLKCSGAETVHLDLSLTHARGKLSVKFEGGSGFVESPRVVARVHAAGPDLHDTVQEWSEALVECDPGPGNRSGHGVVVAGSPSKKAYLFGGCSANTQCLNDFYSFDFLSCQWIQLEATGDVPEPRASFAFVTGPSEGTLILGGGTTNDGPSCDMYEYNLAQSNWRRLQWRDGAEVAAAFLSLYGQSLAAFGRHHLLGFGGTSGNEYFGNLVHFDLAECRACYIAAEGPAPTPRYKHQAIVVGQRMYVLGGGAYRPGPGEDLDCYMLNIGLEGNGHTGPSASERKGVVDRWQWQQLTFPHGAPQARTAAAACYEPGPINAGCANASLGHIYIWGGFNTRLDRLDDLHGLDLATHRWTALDPSPSDEDGQLGHGAVPFPAEDANSGTVGRTRAHSGVHTPPSEMREEGAGGTSGNRLIRFLGDPIERTGTVQRNRDISAGHETLSEGLGRRCPPARAFHGMVSAQGALWVFGGADGSRRYSDVWRFGLWASPPSLAQLAARAPAVQLLAGALAVPPVSVPLPAVPPVRASRRKRRAQAGTHPTMVFPAAMATSLSEERGACLCRDAPRCLGLCARGRGGKACLVKFARSHTGGPASQGRGRGSSGASYLLTTRAAARGRAQLGTTSVRFQMLAEPIGDMCCCCCCGSSSLTSVDGHTSGSAKTQEYTMALLRRPAVPTQRRAGKPAHAPTVTVVKEEAPTSGTQEEFLAPPRRRGRGRHLPPPPSAGLAAAGPAPVWLVPGEHLLPREVLRRCEAAPLPCTAGGLPWEPLPAHVR
mmetsp:Transcript_42072/g.69506  ORF Transcript_42072/g.69506 Transcript_42072/m.69506 type:complete len:909 (+) Transcript_42072:229-2955(+)